MSSIDLMLPLRGPMWEDVAEEDFKVWVCGQGLHVETAVSEKANQVLRKSCCVDFQHAILTSFCHWSCLPDAAGGPPHLVFHLTKDQDRSWDAPFKDGSRATGRDSHFKGEPWMPLRPGRRQHDTLEHLASVGCSATDVVQEIRAEQSDDLVTVDVILRQAAVESLSRELPLSYLWGLELTETWFCLFFRGARETPLLSGTFGANVDPDLADWTIVKMTRETNSKCRELLPVLSIHIRKADRSRHWWEDIIVATVGESLDNPVLVRGITNQFDGQVLQRGAAATGELLDSAAQQGFPSGEEGASAEQLKTKGDGWFKLRDWDQAVDMYTRALELTPDDHKILSNRSVANLEAGRCQQALDDAARAEELAPGWPKALFRRAAALRGLRRYDMAISVFSEGLALDPGNETWQHEIDATRSLKATRPASRRPLAASSRH